MTVAREPTIARVGGAYYPVMPGELIPDGADAVWPAVEVEGRWVPAPLGMAERPRWRARGGERRRADRPH